MQIDVVTAEQKVRAGNVIDRGIGLTANGPLKPLKE